MTWYFLSPKNDTLMCVTPRVASTSQRNCYKQEKFRAVSEKEAKRLFDKGIPAIAYIRNPLERAVSAYRRHKPGFIGVTFMEYVKGRCGWDSHVMPQTAVHSRHGIVPTEWRLFEDLIDIIPRHDNATPEEFKAKHNITTTSDFMFWFEQMYAEDCKIYNALKYHYDQRIKTTDREN